MGDTPLSALTATIHALDSRGVEYALCGGIAVIIHGHVRATKDIDILIPPDKLQTTLAALEEIDFGIVAGPIPLEHGTPRERTLYRASKCGEQQLLTIDLLLVTPVLEDVWKSRQTYTWRGREISVVSLEGLTKMKLIAGRHQDLADLENLGVEIVDEH